MKFNVGDWYELSDTGITYTYLGGEAWEGFYPSSGRRVVRDSWNHVAKSDLKKYKLNKAKEEAVSNNIKKGDRVEVTIVGEVVSVDGGGSIDIKPDGTEWRNYLNPRAEGITVKPIEPTPLEKFKALPLGATFILDGDTQGVRIKVDDNLYYNKEIKVIYDANQPSSSLRSASTLEVL